MDKQKSQEKISDKFLKIALDKYPNTKKLESIKKQWIDKLVNNQFKPK